MNNEQEGVLETQRGLVRLFLGQVRRSRADAMADHRILANQPDGEYASANYEDCSIWRWKRQGPDDWLCLTKLPVEVESCLLAS